MGLSFDIFDRSQEFLARRQFQPGWTWFVQLVVVLVIIMEMTRVIIIITNDDHNDDDEDDNAEPLKIGCVSLKNGWPMDSCPTQ